MKKISDRFRKILRKVFYGIGASVISLILQACYGPMLETSVAYGPPNPNNPDDGKPYYTYIDGKVKAKGTEKPIWGIQVSVEGIAPSEGIRRTNMKGEFLFLVPVQDEYILKFEDIDGPANDGLFKQQTKTFNKEFINNNTILISMEEDIETVEE